MNIVKKIFGGITAILFLFTTNVKAQKPGAHQIDMPAINIVDTKLPITFSWVNFDELGDDAPDIVIRKVQKIISDFYLESNGGDSTEIFKAKDYYFNTLRVPYNSLELFIVILKTPLSYAHCKLFLYDSVSNTVSKKVVDYNTWSMYSIDDNTMKRSDLFKALHLDSDDIMLAKKNKSNLLLKRIKPNGTFSEIEEITYHANGVSLDTVSFKSKKPED